jgi:hypothetical protein
MIVDAILVRCAVWLVLRIVPLPILGVVAAYLIIRCSL